MKRSKKGFTLAEVLITLSIIGVVAALTIPVLTKDFQETQYKVVFKKTFSEISQIFKLEMIDNDNTCRYLHRGIVGDAATSNALAEGLMRNLSVIRYCPADVSAPNVCWYTSPVRYLNNQANLDQNEYAQLIMPAFVLKSGAIVSFVYYSDSASQACTDGDHNLNACGISRVAFDVNGSKGPNILGKDVFFAHITANGLLPYGAEGWYGEDSGLICETNNSAANNQGYPCAAKVIKNEDY